MFVVSVAGASCVNSGDAESAPARYGSPVVASDLNDVAAALPSDPRTAVRALVEAVFAADSHQSAAPAMGELLRRSGFPIVTADGELIALPDDAGFPDLPVYAELLSDLAENVRDGVQYPYAGMAVRLAQAGVYSVPPEWPVIAVLLSMWGKDEAAVPVVMSASSTVRALANAHGQPIDATRDPAEVGFDAVQLMVIFAHMGRNPLPRAEEGAGGGGGVSGHGRPTRRAGACEELNSYFGPLPTSREEKVVDWFEGVMADKATDTLIERLPGSLRATATFIKAVNGDYEELADWQTIQMLMAGYKLRAERVREMHYMHAANEQGAHRSLRVTARYESGLSRKVISCYQLAGIDIPYDGPLTGDEGYSVEWEVAKEAVAPVRDAAGNFTSTGRHVRIVERPAQAYPRAATDEWGVASLSIKPPVEGEPSGVGEIQRDIVVVKASLRKEADAEELILGLLTPDAPVAWLTQNFLNLARNITADAVMPSVNIRVVVAWHGPDPVVAKGSLRNVIVFPWGTIRSVSIDLVSCDGLWGPWRGRNRWGGMDLSPIAAGSLALAEGVSGEKLPVDVGLPISHWVDGVQAVPGEESEFEAFGSLVNIQGVFRLKEDRVNHGRLFRVLKDGRLGFEVGKLDVVLNRGRLAFAGVSMSYTMATFPVMRVDHDDRCPSSPPYWDRS
jgi:hypothetical protein